MVLQIKKLRMSAGMQQGELACACGVGQSVVANWESEVALPRTRDLPRLAEVLGVEIGELFTEDSANENSF